MSLDGHKEVLGLWTNATEGAKFWLQILTEIRKRGVRDLLVACVDGLKGFPEAIQAVYPHTQVQLCIVHLVRNSLQFATWKDRKPIAVELRRIYHAATAEQAEQQLSAFEQRWNTRYASIGKLRRRQWAGVVFLFSFPEEIRTAVYTTNAVESLNSSLRKVIKTRAAFPTEDAAVKLLYLALKNVTKKWKPAPQWRTALNHFMLLWGERIEAAQERPSR